MSVIVAMIGRIEAPQDRTTNTQHHHNIFSRMINRITKTKKECFHSPSGLVSKLCSRPYNGSIMPERVDDEGSSSQYGSVDALTPLAKQESQRKPSKNPKNYPIITRRRSSLEVYRTFFGEFHRSKGSWLIVLLGFLTALGLGSLVGVVPQILTQRYAEELFGYGDDTTKVNSGAAAAAAALCNSFTKTDTAVPTACVQGANYAQSGASYCALAKNALAFLTNSVAGSYSDRHGRRGEFATYTSFSDCMLPLPALCD